MHLEPYVEELRRELAVAAEAGGDDARALAERLTGPLESAVRLALLDALSAAAAEITRDLAPGSIEVRLRGRDPDFVVTPATRPPEDTTGDEAGTAPPPPPPEDDEGRTSRTTLRLPEHLKPRIDDAARREGLSVNAWLVRAVSRALDAGPSSRRRLNPKPGQSYTGWVR